MFASGKTAAVASAANYIEDVFSTYLYTGNSTSGGTQTITNSIDLSTKGGMVWIKGRSAASDHILTDTTRGAGASATNNNALASNLTSAEDLGGSSYDYLSSFSTTGFVVTQGGTTTATRGTNYNNVTYASWTFRKQAKFFDVVTYTGNGTTQNIAHNLGSTPGCIIVKSYSSAANYDWAVYHRSLGATKGVYLNTTQAEQTNNSLWNDTTPTSTQFTVGNSGGASSSTNANGVTYVAYLFAHDAGGFGLTGTDNVISCGSFTGTSFTVNLGYEPQWIMFKRSDAAGQWFMLDTMRGDSLTAQSYVKANASDAESTNPAAPGYPAPTSTGFYGSIGPSGAEYIYIAIRRGPMKVPTSGTSVFSPVTFSFDSFTTAGFPVDFLLSKQYNDVNSWRALDRLRGTTPPSLFTNSTSAESAEDLWRLDNSTGVNNVAGGTINGYENWMFRRAPGFFDEVCYTGTGSATTVTHNLGVVPELIIVKIRDAGAGWYVYNKSLTSAGYYLLVNSTAAEAFSNGLWNSTQPTASSFTVGTGSGTNGNGSTYVAYLFATCAGVSKVGSYTGTATTLQVDCGFTGGARFVLIKRTDSTGDWYVWDSARGIVSGNDSYLLLNSTAAEVTNTDYIDTYSAGFEISSTAPSAINASGGSFIFFAMA